jgi:ATP-dependent Zn protease
MRRFAQSGGGGGLTAIGKSKAKVYVEKDTGVSFHDVAGVESRAKAKPSSPHPEGVSMVLSRGGMR